MEYLIRKVGLVVAAIGIAVPLPSRATSTQKPSFEVASVKPSVPGSTNFRFGSSGGRFSVTMTTVRTLLQIAYDPHDGSAFQNDRIIGAPRWIDTDYFDIDAKVEDSTAGPIPREKLQPMLQSLLEDRFQLKAHSELRALPVYLLTTAKGGPKLTLSDDQTDLSVTQQSIPIEQRRGIMRRTEDGWTANAVRLGALTSSLSQQLGRPVLDKTGLNGLFDFKMHWNQQLTRTPGPDLPSASDPSDPSIFTAVEELGLKVESAKAPLEVLVIDSVQKPSEN